MICPAASGGEAAWAGGIEVLAAPSLLALINHFKGAQVLSRLHLSARGYHRVLRVARTLADLEASDAVRRLHIAEALSYRRFMMGGDLLGR